MEIPFSDGMIINNYINNNGTTLDEALDSISYWMYKSVEIKEILLWMHDYNTRVPEEEKIQFYGFDITNVEKSKEIFLDNLKKIDKKLALEASNKIDNISNMPQETVVKTLNYLKN